MYILAALYLALPARLHGARALRGVQRSMKSLEDVTSTCCHKSQVITL